MEKSEIEKLKWARFKLFWEARALKDRGHTPEDFIYYAENAPEELFSLEAQQALDVIDIDLKHITSIVWTFKKRK